MPWLGCCVNAGVENRAAVPAAAMMSARMMGLSRSGVRQPRGGIHLPIKSRYFMISGSLAQRGSDASFTLLVVMMPIDFSSPAGFNAVVTKDPPEATNWSGRQPMSSVLRIALRDRFHRGEVHEYIGERDLAAVDAALIVEHLEIGGFNPARPRMRRPGRYRERFGRV